MDEKIICCKCNVEMTTQKVTFEYMGIHFNHELPKCPLCNQVYISEELVNSKMLQIEHRLEEK